MKGEGRLTFATLEETHFLEVPIFSPFKDLSQTLKVQPMDSASIRLIHTWQTLSIEIPAGVQSVQLQINRLIPHGELGADRRELSIRVGTPRLHVDSGRHLHIKAMAHNGVHNREELLAGRTQLASTPSILGIDMYGVCNIKPPCVYCDWDAAKLEEGEFVDAPFNLETLEEWGSFFDNASSLINCSIGEPFMMKDFDSLLDVFGDRGKYLEMTTNGQILTTRNIQRLMNRRIELYISLDAASPETFAKLRNDKFEKIVENLRRLIKEKGGRNQYPLVRLVFMPMRVNVHELEAFVKLCADLGVDSLVLRPLNFYDESELDWERAGHHFIYEEELLPFSELIHVSGAAAALCEKHGVPLQDQLDFGDASMEDYFPDDFAEGRQEASTTSEREEEIVTEPVPTSESPVMENPEVSSESENPEPMPQPQTPICHEPWERLYILRRGIQPCCYGATALAPMDRWADVWNSETLQDIRQHLVEGTLHPYCLESTACPVVQKRKEAGKLPWWYSAGRQGKRFARRLDRALFGIPGFFYFRVRWLYRGVPWVSIRLLRALSDPSYVSKHLRNLWRRKA